MDVYFSGLGIEVGQTKKGLAQSPTAARQFLKHYANFDIVDLGDIQWHFQQPLSFLSAKDLGIFKHTTPLEKAYLKTIKLLGSSLCPLLNWGGDHSMAIATVGAFKKIHPRGKVLWIDAHADLNVPDFSLSGSLHGMPLGLLFNFEKSFKNQLPWLEQDLLQPEDLIYFGVRDLDPYEQEIIEHHSITCYSYKHIQERGIETCLDEIKKLIGSAPLHVSFDIDSVDPELAPATGVLVSGGLNRQDLVKLAELIKNLKSLKSLDVAEINPSLGNAAQTHSTFASALLFLNSIFLGGKYERARHSDQRATQVPLAQHSSLSSPTWHLY